MNRRGTSLASVFAALGAGVAIVALLGVVIVGAQLTGGPEEPDTAVVAARAPIATATPLPTPVPPPTATPVPTATPLPTPTATPTPPLWAAPNGFGESGSTTVDGVLTFRGGPTRSYHGEGPVPVAPGIKWSYPDQAMCSPSSYQGEIIQWCGLGWTGQAAVWEREGGLWVAFGAYDRNVHVLDGATGQPRFAPFPTGDLIKGSLSVDPDGFPLLYVGSRDNFLRILSFDQGELVELWKIDARSIQPRLWNDDWDSSPLILGDYMIEGGENSLLHVFELNRTYDDNGIVQVEPELLVAQPGWDQDLLNAVGNNVSIENSVAAVGSVVYFANSGGLVQGWDLAAIPDGGEPEQVFRWWAGDDIDASIVIDNEGFLYLGVEYERANARSQEVGQLIKLDPQREDPLVWSVFDNGELPAGVWATPAVVGDRVYASTESGRLLGVDRETGDIIWEKQFDEFLWGSQVVIDDVLVQGDCAGILHAYDVSDTSIEPPELWAVDIGGCIESTPVLWDGGIFLGTRGGFFHLLAD